MNLRLAREALSQHIEQTTSSDDRNAVFLLAYPAIRAELEPLLDVVQKLREHLVLPEPSSSFREELHAKLVAAAVRQAQERHEHERESTQRTWAHPVVRREIIFGAAALGSLFSVAAAFVVASRARSHTNSRTAA